MTFRGGRLFGVHACLKVEVIRGNRLSQSFYCKFESERYSQRKKTLDSKPVQPSLADEYKFSRTQIECSGVFLSESKTKTQPNPI